MFADNGGLFLLNSSRIAFFDSIVAGPRKRNDKTHGPAHWLKPLLPAAKKAFAQISDLPGRFLCRPV